MTKSIYQAFLSDLSTMCVQWQNLAQRGALAPVGGLPVLNKSKIFAILIQSKIFIE